MTNKEKNTSIEYILAQGFVAPPTLWERITKMHHVLGWRFIFWDLSFSIIFVFVILFALMFLFRHVPLEDMRYSVAVGFSPLIFVLITLLAEISERSCGLYELKQTCRYTSRQVTALRCIYYSVAGVGFAVFVSGFASDSTAQFVSILPLCLGVLFLSATLELSIMRLSQSKWAIAGFSGMWLVVNFMLPVVLGARWEVFLSSLPLAITIVFMVAGVAVFMYQINKMLMEDKNYAIA